MLSSCILHILVNVLYDNATKAVSSEPRCSFAIKLLYCVCIFSAQQVGVIVRLESESFQVLTKENKTMQVKHEAIKKKKDSRHAVALDSENNQLQVKDIVKVIDGAHAVSLLPWLSTCCDKHYIYTTPISTGCCLGLGLRVDNSQFEAVNDAGTCVLTIWCYRKQWLTFVVLLSYL